MRHPRETRENRYPGVPPGVNGLKGIVSDTGGKFAAGVDRWCTLNWEYLREFSKKIEMILRNTLGLGAN